MKLSGYCVKINRKLVKASTNPYSSLYKTWYFHGFVGFDKKAINKLWFCNDACIQVLGFRFTSHVGVMSYNEVLKMTRK